VAVGVDEHGQGRYPLTAEEGSRRSLSG
jgi:hypothetical protein